MADNFKIFSKITHGGVVGLALKRRALLYTVFDSLGGPTIFQVTDKGHESAFAPSFPSVTSLQECEITVNPGFGHWRDKVGFVYVTQGSKIFEITPDGFKWEHFADIPPVGNFQGTAITFDQVGTFSHDMIVTDTKGNVYRAKPWMRGTTLTPFVNVGAVALGDTIAVVSKRLGPHGGELWVTSEATGNVYSVSPTTPPTVNTIINIPGAGNVSAIPDDPENFGSSGGAFFVADWMNNGGQIVQWPKSAFHGLGGNVLVGQETGGGLYIIKWNGSKYVSSLFENKYKFNNSEGASFLVRHHHCCDDCDDDY
jgi:hypothetical protein